MADHREALIVAHLALARAKAAYYAARCGLEREDLEQEAMVGLCLAADRWRPESFPGIGFGCFAKVWIRRHLEAAIRTEGHSIPDRLARARWRPRRVRTPIEYFAVLDREPDLDNTSEQVWDALSLCDREQRAVVVRLYGLGDHCQRTVNQIAHELRMPRARVRSLADSALGMIGRELARRGWTAESWATAM